MKETKLAVSTLGCADKSLEDMVSLLRRCGIAGMEIRGIGGEMAADRIPCLQKEARPRTRAYLKENGIRPLGFGTSVQLHRQDLAAENLAEGAEAIALCRDMGMGFIRVFGNDLPADGEERQAALSSILHQGRELCRRGTDAGVQVLLEIHGTVNTAENLAPVLDGLGQETAFGLIWDVMHTDRAVGDGWETLYPLIRPFVRHVHVKDHLRHSQPPFRQVPVGEGDIPLPDILHRLAQDGYGGWYSLEWERAWHPDLAPAEEVFPAYAAYMQAL